MSRTLGLLLILGAAPVGPAADPFRYPEAKHKGGELRTIDHTPVLVAGGSPAEVGEQYGVLVLKPAGGLIREAERLVRDQGWGPVYPLMLRLGAGMAPRFPPDHLAELDAAAKASGVPRELLILGGTAPDLRYLAGCSALLVEPARSATGGPLVGRNLDWPPVGRLPEYTLVVVRRPAGKRAFAAVTFPGMVGVATGMNDAGLTVADLSVTAAADGSPQLDPAGTPYTLLLRRVLEECRTVAEAEALIRGAKRTVRQNVAVCDRVRAAVFEVTPKTVVVRPATDGLAACTNHFRSPGLAKGTDCPRYDALDAARRVKVLTVADVAARMGDANQGRNTIQTMVFEPAAGRLHLAFGYGPATRLPVRTIDLNPLFAGK